MDQMIKENILYPEVEDTEEDILEEKDFENLQFLKENACGNIIPSSPRQVISSASKLGVATDNNCQTQRGFHDERYLFGEITSKANNQRVKTFRNTSFGRKKSSASELLDISFKKTFPAIP